MSACPGYHRRRNFLKKFALCAPPALWQVWDVSTLTIELPDDLAARLEAASAQLVRVALEKARPASGFPAEGPSAYDLMKDGFGCVSSGVRDLATNPKHLEGFGQWQR